MRRARVAASRAPLDAAQCTAVSLTSKLVPGATFRPAEVEGKESCVDLLWIIVIVVIVLVVLGYLGRGRFMR